MISGFLDLWEPLFIDFNIQKYSRDIRNIREHVSKDIVFVNLKIWEIKHSEHLEQIWKRRAQKMMKIRSTNLGYLGYEINIYQKT